MSAPGKSVSVEEEKPNFPPIAMFSVTKNPTLGAIVNSLYFWSPVFSEWNPTDPEMKISPLPNPFPPVDSCALANPKANTAATVKIIFLSY